MPSLTFEALKKQIAGRKLGAVHLFVGSDVQLIHRMIEAVEGTIDEADRAFAVERLHAGDPGGMPVDIADVARTFPMLGDRRIVIVMRAERLLKPKRPGRAGEDDDGTEAESDSADGAVDTGPLETYLAAPMPSTTLLLVAADIDRSRRLTKRVLDKALVTEFEGNERDDPRADARSNLVHVLHSTFKREGREIDRDAAVKLLERAGGDVTKLRDDLERLILFVADRRQITEDDVMEVSADANAVDDEWAIVNAIAAGDTAAALRETGKRLDRGDAPYALVGQLRWWVSVRLAERDAGRVKPALDALLRTDLALKSSGGEPRVLVERLVVELSAPTRAQRPPRGAW